MERQKEWSIPPAMLFPSTPSQSTVTVILTAHSILFTMFTALLLYLNLGGQVLQLLFFYWMHFGQKEITKYE